VVVPLALGIETINTDNEENNISEFTIKPYSDEKE